jgi:CHAT domain-containing protein/Flp pilus assembly protein TadD
MKQRLLIIAILLALFVQGAGFGQTVMERYNRGIECYNQGNYAEAIEYFLELKNIFEEAQGKENLNYASLVNNLGLAYDKMGDYANAERYYLETIAVRGKVLGREHPDYAASLGALGMLYYNMGNYGSAERYFLETLAVRERVLGREHPEYVTTLNNLGVLYSDTGDYVKARRYYLEATAIRETVLGKGHPDYATSLNNLGVLYSKMSDYGNAMRCLLEAKAVRETVLGKEHPSYAISLNNLGSLYKNTGDYGNAERCYLEAITVREKALGKEHPDYAGSINNLGSLYHDMGDYGNAERYYLEAAAIYEKVLGREHPSYVTSLNNLGVLYDNMDDYANAERYYLEAAAVRERVLGKEHSDYAGSINNLGVFYWRTGDYGKAERYHLEATAVWEKVLGKEHPTYAASLNNLGQLYSSMGNNGSAERYFLEAAAVWERALGKEHPSYTVFLNNLYALYLGTNNYTRALAVKQEADRLKTGTINRNFSFLSGQQRTAYWNSTSSSFEQTYSLSLFHPVPESNILNYDNALFAKGLLLRTTNAVRDAIYSSGNQTLIGQFEELGRKRQQISALQQGGGNEAWIKNLEAEAEVLDKSLTQASAAFREFQEDLNINWRNVRDSLQPNEAAVEFVSFRIYGKGWSDKTRYAALVLRHGTDAPAWVPLCEETVLDELFRELAGQNSSMQAYILYDEKGRELYNAVWQPLENMLNGVTTVYYSPSGLLHKVAFNAIPVDEDTRLMDVYNLNLVSSTREVVYLKTKTAGTPRSAVVYGGLLYDADENTMRREALAYNAPETGTVISTALPAGLRGGRNGWGYLAGTNTEQTAIQQMLAANRIPPTVYNGAGGNEESFKALNGRKISILHLATHGFFIEDIEKSSDNRELIQRIGGGQEAFENPLLRSGLILAGGNRAWRNNSVAGVEDGILFADEVSRLNLLGTELVVLSACETALGEVNNSEGVFGLQRSFKLAGAQTLVMSLWTVDDQATGELMENFYRNWLSGKSKQEAMKEAQRSLRSNEDYDYESPFYWAAFVLMD